MWQKRDFYKIFIYFLQWLAISDKRPRIILVKNVFRIVQSRMCKNTRFGLFTFFRPMKKLTQIYIKTLNWWYWSDIASSTNKKCSLNWKLRHPERKSFLKENSMRHVFLKFSPCFSVKFAHFGEHFSLNTPMECVYVCLFLVLLKSSYFNRKFTRKLHCLHQITTPLFFAVSSIHFV